MGHIDLVVTALGDGRVVIEDRRDKRRARNQCAGSGRIGGDQHIHPDAEMLRKPADHRGDMADIADAGARTDENALAVLDRRQAPEIFQKGLM